MTINYNFSHLGNFYQIYNKGIYKYLNVKDPLGKLRVLLGKKYLYIPPNLVKEVSLLA